MAHRKTYREKLAGMSSDELAQEQARNFRGVVIASVLSVVSISMFVVASVLNLLIFLHIIH